MLNIVFGREKVLDESKMVLDTRVYFTFNKKPEWFENDFVKRFLKEIDNTEVLFEEALKDYRGRGISTEMISTGCKTLCDIYYCTDNSLWFYGSAMGANCLPFIEEIAMTKDVNLFYEHFPIFSSTAFEKQLIYVNNIPVNEDNFDDIYAKWCEELYIDNDDEEDSEGNSNALSPDEMELF